MQRIWTKLILAAGVGAMAMLPQGCKRQASAPAQTVAAPARVKPVQGVDPLPIADPVVDAQRPSSQVRHRRRGSLPQPVQPLVDTSQVDARAVAEQQRQQDAALLKEQEAASQRQQQELNHQLQESQKARAQELEQTEQIQDAPGPSPGASIQDAPGPSPGSSIQDAPGPSQTLSPVPPQTAPQQ
jgi:hypothetical protein